MVWGRIVIDKNLQSPTNTNTNTLPQPHLRRPRMGLQPFAVRQHRGDLAEHLGALFADFDDAAALLKVVHAQR